MIITEGDLGGAQRHVRDISEELTRRGHAVTIAVGGEQAHEHGAFAPNEMSVPIVHLRHLVRPLSFGKDVRAFFEIFRLVRHVRPDIVHCHSSKAGAIASIAGRFAGAVVVYTAHGFVFREELGMFTEQFYEWSERVASWFRHRVIAVSQSDADAARSRHVVAARKLLTIPNGIDLNLEHDLESPEAARHLLSAWTGEDLTHAKIALSIANFFVVKNVPLLVRAFEYVIPRVPEARLVLIGDGVQRALCETIVAHSNTLRGKVFFVGKRPHAFRVLRAADVMCLASTKEGLPYVVLEAKLARTPVVATRVGGVPEMGEGEDLRLVVPHSAEMLSDAIVDILRRPHRAAAPIEKVFSLSAMVDAIEGVYSQIVFERRKN